MVIPLVRLAQCWAVRKAGMKADKSAFLLVVRKEMVSAPTLVGKSVVRWAASKAFH